MADSGLAVILWLAAGAILVLLIMRRKKRNILK